MTTPLKPIDGDWFQFRDLGEGITLITEPHVIPFLRCNIWHIRGRGLDLMVDTGLGVSSLHAASRHLFGQRIAALAALDDAAFRAMFAGTPVKRTGRDRFVRNVMIAIGNAGDPALAAVVEPVNAPRACCHWEGHGSSY